MSTYQVVFSWPKNESIAGWYKRLVERKYMTLYNKFSNEVNKKIDDFNAEADALGLTENIPNPNVDLAGWYESRYMKFMKDCYSSLLGRMIRCEQIAVPAGMALYIGDELELHMIIKKCVFANGKDVDLDFVLKEVGA